MVTNFVERKDWKGKEQKKPTRTISGVAPISVMVPPKHCPHGVCVYCPTFDNSPQSYTPESPAVLRALALEYDPGKQVLSRLKSYNAMGHPTNKIELIIMGGTFMGFPRDFQFEFVKKCYDALNGCESKNLAEAKKINETAKNRCVALCIETRPDHCDDQKIADMLEFGTTRVEIGVQVLDDAIYKKINRGHTVADVIFATKQLKKAGFKLGYHIMPGLPDCTPEKDLKMYEEIFSSEKYKPDQIKIYPCQVVAGTGLEKWYYKKMFVPYDEETVRDLIIRYLQMTPRYTRVMRIMREIPSKFLVAGLKRIDLRKEVEEGARKSGKEIEEIRFREIGFALRDDRKDEIKPETVGIRGEVYECCDGKEFFLECVDDNNILYGLLRLRIENDSDEYATVRELHVYSPALNLGEEDEKSFQHRGMGKELMDRAEKLAIAYGRKKIRVISGVGVREYYEKNFGYKLDDKGWYVEKDL